MDLLEHEMAKFTLVRHVIRAGEQGWHPLLTLPLSVVKLHPQWRKQGHLAVFHRKNRAGKTGQSRGIAGTEKLAFSQTNQ